MSNKNNGKLLFLKALKIKYSLKIDNHVAQELVWSPDGEMLAMSSSQGRVVIWDTIKQCYFWDFPSHPTPILHTHYSQEDNYIGLFWSPDSKTLACTDSNGVTLWNIKGKQKIFSFKDDSLDSFSPYLDRFSWSPNGKLIAWASSTDNAISIFNNENGTQLHKIQANAYEVSWSPNGRWLCALLDNRTIRVWNAETWKSHTTLTGLSQNVFFDWNPTGKFLVAASADIMELWNIETGNLHRKLINHVKDIDTISWSPDGAFIISGAKDKTIRIWNCESGQQTNILEGHTAGIIDLNFSSDGRLLASLSADYTMRYWRVDNWDLVGAINATSTPNICFHPHLPLLATIDKQVIQIREIDFEQLFGLEQKEKAAHYTNAKIVLVGDTGVGKTGLGLVLTGQPYAPTDSTHGRHIWVLKYPQMDSTPDKETREILLWDLAGQPGYRLIHQLNLNEVAIALVIFDARSEIDPFAGVRYWVRALHQAQSLQDSNYSHMKKFLIAARTDRGSISISKERLHSLKEQFGFDEIFETSAKEGKNIAGLIKAIHEFIDWKSLPKVSSTELFYNIKNFLMQQKLKGMLLNTIDSLYEIFLIETKSLIKNEELMTQFKTCIKQMESRGLIRQLSFANYILLQPELLDVYASAIVNAAKDEPDGMGSIAEHRVKSAHFPISQTERINNKSQEQILILATIEDLLRHEIALRENTEHEVFLVFPSQFTRDINDLFHPQEKTIIFSFEGAIQNIYATLVVRLSNSSIFQKKDMWKNAVSFNAMAGGECGIFIKNVEEGQGELTLFFDSKTSETIRFQFEEYIDTHLKRRALTQTIKRRRIFICKDPTCKTEFTEQQVLKRIERKYNYINCNVCDKPIPLNDGKQRLSIPDGQSNEVDNKIDEMDRAANAQRDYQIVSSILEGKKATKDFDVFLCYSRSDKLKVREIGEQLKHFGLLPWFDEWQAPPFNRWQDQLEKDSSSIKTVAIFIASSKELPWEDVELKHVITYFTKLKTPIALFLMSDYLENPPSIPLYLSNYSKVDFRFSDPYSWEQMLWGITNDRDYAQKCLKSLVEQKTVKERHKSSMNNLLEGNTMHNKVDVAIIIALSEEFSEFISELNHTSETIDGEYYYRFEYPTIDSQPSYKCVVTCIGGMNNHSAGICTQKTISNYKPSVVIILGFAGSLDKDVSLGDVTIISQVDSYLDSAKATGEEEFELQLGGQVYRSDFTLVNICNHFKHTHKEDYKKWCDICSKNMLEIPEKDRNQLLAEQLMKEQVALVSEEVHLASGPVVSATTKFVEWLHHKRDRKLTVIEMESAGFMVAAWRQVIPPKTLIIRAISDFGDSRKKNLDMIKNGAVRSYALKNAKHLLMTLLETQVFPR